MIIDHIGFVVSDYARSKNFYLKSLKPLGITLIMEIQGLVGFGKNGKAQFWLAESEGEEPHKGLHIAFLAEGRGQVDAFYEAALSEGATDNGKPGIREIYHPNYYGAFVIDRDGHNIEAVYHG